MHILLSNDDGIQAEGLRRLEEGLRESLPKVRISVCAPDREQSASSHALTLTEPLRIHEHGERRYSVTGTPTDCVLLALRELFAEDPIDFVVSGINHGPNLGEDIHYSGTVAAAMEGTVYGLPSLAISMGSRGENPADWEAADHFVRQILPGWMAQLPREARLINVNVPAGPVAEVMGVRICKLGSRVYQDVITAKTDPRGRSYYWIGGNPVAQSSDESTDLGSHRANWITVTPLDLDMTDYKAMVEMDSLENEWPS